MPAQPARGERALQLGAEFVEIACAALDLSRARRQQPAHGGEVVLEIVDGDVGVARRRPGERRGASLEGARAQARGRGNHTLDRPHQVEHVERRHPRTRFVDLDARERQVEMFRRGADRQRELQTFVGSASGLRGERGAGGWPAVIGQQRVFADLLRKHPLGETRHEHDAEGAAARRVGRADKDTAMAPARRLVRQRRQAWGQHIADFAQAHRANGGQRCQFLQQAQHARRLRNYAWRQLPNGIEPVTPQLLRRPFSHFGKHRFRERAKRTELLAVAGNRTRARRFGVVRRRLAQPAFVLVLEALQPALPAIEAADHGGFNEQVFPTPRSAQGAGDVAFGFAAQRRGLRFFLRLGVLRPIGGWQHGVHDFVGGR